MVQLWLSFRPAPARATAPGPRGGPRPAPAWVGETEFGTTVHADHASRVRWTRFNRRLAETRGISWGVWSMAPTSAVYDLAAHAFDPDLLAALME